MQKIFACLGDLVGYKLSPSSDTEQVRGQTADIKLKSHKADMIIKILLRELFRLILVASGLVVLGALMALEEYVLWH